MATDSATSPRARKVITLDAVPPGQQPTRITPTATSGGNCSPLASNHASPGMMMNWPSTPMTTSMGRLATSLKSSLDSVRPMPNMIRPSSGTM